MRECQFESCDSLATHSPVLRIPSIIYPIQEQDPMRVLTGLQLCQHHAADTEPKDLLSDQLKALINQTVQAENKMPCDYERAFTEVIELSDPDWIAFQRTNELRNREENK